MRRRWFWIILIIVLLIAGGLTAGRMRAPKAAPVQQAEEVIPVEVAPVEPATLERTVEVSGSLTSARMTEAQPRRSGPVARVRAPARTTCRPASSSGPAPSRSFSRATARSSRRARQI